jgi:hypothetical protein
MALDPAHRRPNLMGVRFLLCAIALGLFGTAGCWGEAGTSVMVSVDNQSSSSVVLEFTGESFEVPAYERATTGSSSATVPTLSVVILTRTCEVMASYAMTPPGSWLISVDATGATTVSSKAYLPSVADAPPVLWPSTACDPQGAGTTTRQLLTWAGTRPKGGLGPHQA